jgi:hypothetical protein
VVRQLPPDVRRFFAPLPERDVDRVRAMSEPERASYLAAHPTDALRLERAREKRDRRGPAKTTPTLEGLDLSAQHSKEH